MGIKHASEEMVYFMCVLFCSKGLTCLSIWIKQNKYRNTRGKWIASEFIIFPYSGPLRGNFEAYVRRGRVNLEEVMRFEALRIKSFYDVDVNNSPIRLAKAGFYATGNDGETRCYSCGARRIHWENTDNPHLQEFHKRGCRHIQGLNASNVSFQENPLPYEGASHGIDQVLDRDRVRNVPFTSSRLLRLGNVGNRLGSLDIFQEYGVITRNQGHVNREFTNGIEPSTARSQGLDMSNAVSPEYQNIHRRIDSFHGRRHVHDPVILSSAGFYYAGYKDCVRCFYCGIRLRDWEAENDPWVEHVRYSPSCAFIRWRTGEEFFKQTLANNNLQQNRSSNNDRSSSREGREQSPQEKSLEELKAENDRLKAERSCIMCLENIKDIVFLPCGHIVTCAECAPAFTKCPLCRKDVKGFVRTLLG